MFVHSLEETLIQTLKTFELIGQRTEDVGIWIEGTRKIAAFGISCSRWVTMHGKKKII